MHLRLFLAILLFQLFSASTLAASFDCTKATTDVERTICNDQRLIGYDAELNGNYQWAIINLPVVESNELRKVQLAWLKKRNACAVKSAELKTCLQNSMKQRVSELVKMTDAAFTSLDNTILMIPVDPATAAQTLKKYRSPLATAWLVYLHQFEPGSGVTADEAVQYQKQAIDGLITYKVIDIPVIDEHSTLKLLRMSIEEAGYKPRDFNGKYREYVHCFIFERHGQSAYSAFSPWHGSFRDGFAPICSPQGTLFESDAWRKLNEAFKPVISRDVNSQGSIRYSWNASWKMFNLQVSISPQDFLRSEIDPQSPEKEKLIASYGDPESKIQAWDDKSWPLKEREAVLREMRRARQATENWLQTEKKFSVADAKQAADAIITRWVIDRLFYISDNI